MKKISLTQGKFALIDDDDFEMINLFKWCAHKAHKAYYAVAVHRDEDRKQRLILMHRLIMNASKGTIVDHINHDTLDNRKSNLRFCTHSQNIRNQRIQSRKKSSKYKGVTLVKSNGRWASYIKVKNKRIGLGYYENEIDAARAYNKAALKYHKEFAVINILKEYFHSERHEC